MEVKSDVSVTRDPLIDDKRLSAAELAAFIDGRLQGAELERVQGYLADHPEARQELIAASRIVGSAPVRASQTIRRWAVPGIGLAAAAALLVVTQLRPNPKPEHISTERREAVEQTDRIDLVSPANGEQLFAGPMVFSWHRYDGASYRLVISDATGRVLHEETTSDTLVSISPSVLKGTSGRLYWTIDALANNGSSLTSGVSEFKVLPR